MMRTLRIIRLRGLLILLGILAIIGLIALLSLLASSFGSIGTALDCASNDPAMLTVAQDVRDRLSDVGLDETQFMNSTGIYHHIQRLCDDEITLELLYTYANHIESLNQIGDQYGQAVPSSFWDVQTRAMRDNNTDEYQTVDALVNSNPDYAQLLIRAYNRFYTFQQNSSTDTALDTAFDIFLYTVEYYDQITDVDFDTMDDESAHDIGIDIVRTWQHLIGSTGRINPLTGEPIFPYSIFSHLSVTDMWRHHTHRNRFIGNIWGISGYDFGFVGEHDNTNQVEHTAVTMALQYVYGNSIIVLNAIEIRDTVNGKQEPAQSLADQSVNNAIATEFIPRFEENYVETIEHLRCVLSNPETSPCT